jgi:hypothetical protein
VLLPEVAHHARKVIVTQSDQCFIQMSFPSRKTSKIILHSQQTTKNRNATKKKSKRSNRAARMTIENSPTSTIASTPGMAGRTNYAKWDKIATTLVQQVEDEAKIEEKEEKAKVCELSFWLAGLVFRYIGSSTKQQLLTHLSIHLYSRSSDWTANTLFRPMTRPNGSRRKN